MTRHTLFSLQDDTWERGLENRRRRKYHPLSLRIGLDSVRSINTLLTLDPFQLPKGLERRSPLTRPPPLAKPHARITVAFSANSTGANRVRRSHHTCHWCVMPAPPDFS